MSIKFFSKLSLVAITAGVALSGMASSASAGFLSGVVVKPFVEKQVMGNRCETPFGVSGPGPINPIGSPCTFNGSRGVVVSPISLTEDVIECGCFSPCRSGQKLPFKFL